MVGGFSEAVENCANAVGVFAEDCERIVPCGAFVDDDGQPELRCEVELRAKCGRLCDAGGEIVLGDPEVIEACLADCYDSAVRCDVTEGRNEIRDCFSDIIWVNTNDCKYLRPLFR